MYFAARNRRDEWADLLHVGAGATGVVLFASWVGFVAAEAFRPDFNPVGATYLQAATLVVVFLGYAVGWRSPRAGGTLSLAGMALFFAASLYGGTPAQAVAESPALLFAAPALMNLLSARSRTKRELTAGMT